MGEPRNKKVAHVITGLNVGGAERMLVKLIPHLVKQYEVHVISLGSEGVLGAQIRRAGASVIALDMKNSPTGILIGLSKLIRVIRQLKPQVVQTWLYHADLLGGIAARIAGTKSVAWNIRSGNLPADSNRSTRVVVKFCALLSFFIPDVIVCCARRARERHRELGYNMEKFRIIPNGFQLTEFTPDAVARKSVRKELSIPENAEVIGLIARFDPQKNHELFIEAASLLLQRSRDAYFVLAGRNVDRRNPELLALLTQYQVMPRVRLLGERGDIARLTAAMDVATCCSDWGEAFPNALGEALACAVPCVSTDVGDAAEIIGESGKIVERNDAASLASAWTEILDLPETERRVLGASGRQRMMQNYDIESIGQNYLDLYNSLIFGELGDAVI